MTAPVTRRSALTASAAVVVGAVAGLLYGRHSHAAKAGSVGLRYPSSPNGRTLIARLAAIPVGGGVIRSGVVVTRPAGDEVHAFSSSCTHLGCTVNSVSHGKIFCPCHGSVFDAATGGVLQGPASAPLPRAHVSIVNGGVYLS
jgi:Rieske Fe-S protein